MTLHEIEGVELADAGVLLGEFGEEVGVGGLELEDELVLLGGVGVLEGLDGLLGDFEVTL